MRCELLNSYSMSAPGRSSSLGGALSRGNASTRVSGRFPGFRNADSELTSKSMARIQIETLLPFDYILQEAKQSPPRELCLLLHGYLQHGPKILRELGPVLPDTALVLAPNGPFPLPYPSGDHFKVANAWYFYDAKKDDYFVAPTVAARTLARALDQLAVARPEIARLPLRIIGFSQGGYLAPIAAESLPLTRQVILIAASVLPDEIAATVPFRVDAVHGDGDEVVACAGAAERHAQFIAAGNSGKFTTVAGTGHEMSALRPALAEAIAAFPI